MACMTAARLGRDDAVRVARVREGSYREIQEGDEGGQFIDLMINPEQVTADKVLALLRYPGVTEVLEFAQGKVSLLGLRIVPESLLAGLRLQEFTGSVEFLVVAIERGELVCLAKYAFFRETRF